MESFCTVLSFYLFPFPAWLLADHLWPISQWKSDACHSRFPNSTTVWIRTRQEMVRIT